MTKYHSERSTTYHKDGRFMTLKYGDTVIEGVVGQDNFGFGSLTVKNFLFTEATKVSNSLIASQFDGILGLGFQSVSVLGLPTLFDQMIAQGLVTDNSFSFYLTQTESAPGSKLVLGGVNSKYYTGEMRYSPLATNNLWMIKVEAAFVGGNRVTILPFHGIVETGSAVIYGSPDVIDLIQFRIGKVGQIDCSEIAGLPTIGFEISGHVYELPAEAYVLKLTDSKGKTQCVIGIQAVKMPSSLGSTIVLGDVFVKYYYTHFDEGKARIGFAKAVKI
jgi:cathepsin D